MNNTANHQEDMENDEGINDNDNIDMVEEDSDDEDVELEFNMDVFQRLKQNDPSVTRLCMELNSHKDHFGKIDWKEDGDCISNNTQLKDIFMCYNDWSMRQLGEERKVPPRQQIQDFFSCIYQNRSITDLGTHTIIDDEFSGSLVERLSGHPSITKLEFQTCKMGGIVFSALGKVLKHPKCKLKDLRLSFCQLDDEGLGLLCGGLVGNITLKKLRLSNNNNDITLAGWQAFSTFLRHPKCKLVQLDLPSTLINDDATNLLGTAAISSTSLKALNLSSNKSISSRGWQTLLNHLSQSSIRRLDIGRNNINDAGLVSLANINALKSLDLSNNKSITETGFQFFFNTLQARGTQLVKLKIASNRVGDIGLAALSRCNMTMLKALSIYYISGRITSQGWVSFFNALQDSNLDLVRLDLSHNNIDDEGLQLLVPLVSNMSSLKHFSLHANHSITPTGWQALTGYLQSPNFALEKFTLGENKINNATLAAFMSDLVLVHNKTLKRFYLDECLDEDEDNLITERGWAAVSTLVCNKTSIMDTYSSNHILQALGWDHDQINMPDDLLSYLELNENKDKAEVARQKILQTHFSNSDKSKMQEFLDMELEVMPAAIAWMGKPTNDDWIGKSMSGLSLMYNLMRSRVPDLFDSSAQKKLMHPRKKPLGVGKRKHVASKIRSRCTSSRRTVADESE